MTADITVAPGAQAAQDVARTGARLVLAEQSGGSAVSRALRTLVAELGD